MLSSHYWCPPVFHARRVGLFISMGCSMHEKHRKEVPDSKKRKHRAVWLARLQRRAGDIKARFTSMRVGNAHTHTKKKHGETSCTLAKRVGMPLLMAPPCICKAGSNWKWVCQGIGSGCVWEKPEAGASENSRRCVFVGIVRSA